MPPTCQIWKLTLLSDPESDLRSDVLLDDVRAGSRTQASQLEPQVQNTQMFQFIKALNTVTLSSKDLFKIIVSN